MIPRRIELENFLSFGQPAVEFHFTDDEPLWVLCGRNGSGKSAVFDGITYALYGEHRGGTQKADELIRHGANGFRVVFEFTFDRADYRITRARAGKTTQKIERRVDGEWEAIPGVNTAGQLKAWVAQTLGLGYEAFTTSVLLRQGEADKLFSASRDDRIAVLKGIIGFERFEEVSNQVRSATAGRKSTLDSLKSQVEGLVPVAPEELKNAESQVKDADQKRETAQKSLIAASQRVEQAKQWEKLDKERKDLEHRIEEAAARATVSQNIREDKAALDDLNEALPTLEALFKVRGRIAGLTKRLNTARDVLRVLELTRDIQKEEKLLVAVEEIERFDEELKGYAEDLDGRLDTVIDAENEAGQALQEKRISQTEAQTLFKEAQKQLQQFATVDVGVICSRCRQPVSAEHAETERILLEQETQKRREEVDKATLSVASAERHCSAAQAERKNLEGLQTARNNLVMRLEIKRQSLSAWGEFSTAAEVRARLAGLRTELTGADGPLVSVDPKRLDAEAKAAENEIQRHGTDLATAQREEELMLAHLSDPWKEQLPGLDANRVAELAAERNRLVAEKVSEKFQALEEDDRQRANWQEQLTQTLAEIDDLPAGSRIPEADAKDRQAATKVAADQAEEDRRAAVQARDDLARRMKHHEDLTAALRKAERDYDLHKKLDDLLGKDGLQRELVRDAEQQIVDLANDTLQHLSDGDLSLEQDDEATGRDDKAFALRVRRVGDPLPIGVLFLSGSQKFRVAVSVALAVGRFASGRARPLEAVIIDEGFGSLDKDGLRAMADELKRLQQSQSLKRVVLVSHQDEFTDHFPVGYRLNPGEHGTMAVPFRR